MKVSVILPNFNHAAFLKQRMESILNQTYQNFELIILDDGSTDESKAIIELYRGHKNVSEIVYNEVNSGSVFSQWSKGISIASGELIWIAESDDWCENNFLETLVSGLEKYPGCSIAVAQTFCVDENGIILWQTHYPHIAACIKGIDFVRARMLKHNSVVNAGMAIFRKECYEQVSKEFRTFTFSGDWLFWIELALLGDVFITGRLLNFFRYHGNNVTSRSIRSGHSYKEHLKLLSIIREREVINQADFERLVGFLYKKYLFEKSRYTPGENTMIRQAFHDAFPAGEFGSFLFRFNIYWLRRRLSKFRNTIFVPRPKPGLKEL